MKTHALNPFRGAALALCLLFASSAQALVIDLSPPDFRGKPGTVFASWEFFLDPTPFFPPAVFPDEFDVVPTSNGEPIFPVLPLLLGVTPFGPLFDIATFLMPNFISDHDHALYRIQTSMVFGAAIPVALAGVGIVDEFNISIGTPVAPPTILPLPLGFYYTQDFLVSPSPDLALVNLLVPAAGTPFVVNVIIESRLIPEPGVIALLASGILLLVTARRLRRARRADSR